MLRLRWGGARSFSAIAKLLEAGVKVDLYNVVDGFEGDKGESGARGEGRAGADGLHRARAGGEGDLWAKLSACDASLESRWVSWRVGRKNIGG